MATTKKLCFTGPSYLPPEQFYQPGDCEEAGWPDVTHIVASAFEGPGSPLSPEMGWLNRFCVFTCGLPPSAHFNLSNNKRWTDRPGVSPNNGWIFYQMIELSCKWHNIYSWVSIQGDPIGTWTIQQPLGFMHVRDTLSCVSEGWTGLWPSDLRHIIDSSILTVKTGYTWCETSHIGCLQATNKQNF